MKLQKSLLREEDFLLKQKKKMNKKGLWALLGLLVSAGGLMAATSSNDKKTNKLPRTSYDGDILITNHDGTWDYKRENGIWFTKKKTSTTWINMKDSLSTENYNLAISRLEKFIGA